MEEYGAYEDQIFFNAFGMRQWESRHAKVTELLDSFDSKRVTLVFL